MRFLHGILVRRVVVQRWTRNTTGQGWDPPPTLPGYHFSNFPRGLPGQSVCFSIKKSPPALLLVFGIAQAALPFPVGNFLRPPGDHALEVMTPPMTTNSSSPIGKGSFPTPNKEALMGRAYFQTILAPR